MAIKGLSQSASDSIEPVARSSERCGARSKPFLMMSERIILKFQVVLLVTYVTAKGNRRYRGCHARETDTGNRRGWWHVSRFTLSQEYPGAPSPAAGPSDNSQANDQAAAGTPAWNCPAS